MTDTDNPEQTDTVDTDEQTDTDTDTDEQTDTDTDGTDERTPSREAAAYRRRLRDTEAERDTLAGRVEALQRREAERIAGQHLADPTDLWLLGDDLDELLTDGDIDAAKVSAAARAIVSTRPRLAAPPLDLGQGARSGYGHSEAPSWTSALQPQRRT